MNRMTTEIDLSSAKNEVLIEAIKVELSSLGNAVPDEDYDLEGLPKSEVQSDLDERALNETWQRIYALVRRVYKNKVSQVEAGLIIEAALDYNYGPSKLVVPIARYMRSVEAVLNGEEPEATGREAGIEAINVDDAGPRRDLINILKQTHKRVKSNFRSAAKKLVSKGGYSPLEAVKIVHSCNRGEDSDNSEIIGNALCDLYKAADSDGQADIIEFLHQTWDDHNLRGRIKKPLIGFNVDGVHPFNFIKSEQIARDKKTLEVIQDVKSGRVRRLQPPRGKKGRKHKS